VQVGAVACGAAIGRAENCAVFGDWAFVRLHGLGIDRYLLHL